MISDDNFLATCYNLVMYFKIVDTLKEFSDWLSSHYFVKHRVIHKFNLKTSKDGQFYQWGTPRPPIFILRIFVEIVGDCLKVTILPFDKPGKPNSDLVEIAIDNCLAELLAFATIEFGSTSPLPTAQ